MHKEAGRGREEKKDPSGSTCTTEHQERVEEQAGAPPRPGQLGLVHGNFIPGLCEGDLMMIW